MLSSGVIYCKNGNVVTLKAYTDRAVPANDWVELGTLPSEASPSAPLYFAAQVSSRNARGYVSDLGRVAVYTFEAMTSSILFTITYVV